MRISGALLALALLACRVSEPRPLSLVLTVDPTQLTASDSVAVVIDAYNTSSRTVSGQAPGNYGPCNHSFRVFAGDQEVAVPVLLCAQALLPPVDIPPGGIVTTVDYWKPGASTLNGQPLTPGLYRLVGHYHANDETFNTLGAGISLIP